MKQISLINSELVFLFLIMQQNWRVKRNTALDKDFLLLVTHLDHELWVELKEDQATYDQYNKVPDLQTAIVIYEDGIPAACGCFKEVDSHTIEIKRMFVQKDYRGKGLSKTVLHELEKWAEEKGFRSAILETSIHFSTARSLYQRNGYTIIPNYGPYVGLQESVCMKKELPH